VIFNKSCPRTLVLVLGTPMGASPSKLDTTFDTGAREVTWELGGRRRRGWQRTGRPACGKQRYPAWGHGGAEMGGGGGWGMEREEHLHLAEPPRREAVV
jgi:hypothetical protein